MRAGDLQVHLDAAYRWICSAQDATPDRGVSGCYNLLRGWAGSYAETTGYIIPTFLHYSRVRKVPDARFRALQMAEWETNVQLPSGAVRSGMLGTAVGPAVFNTGQVLFGWVSAYQETENPSFGNAARQAADWLISVQDDDGAWRKHLSMLTTSSVQTYNVRAAWGLALTGVEFNEPRWKTSAIKNCEWALTQQKENGWFARNAFSDHEKPLLHTIGYVLEGLLGVGELLGHESCVQAVISGVEPLVGIWRKTGKLHGRYDENWQPTVKWRCITGEAQVALVLERLSRITGRSVYVEMSQNLLQSVACVQNMDNSYPAAYGGVPGSEPIWGGYGPFNYLNWAAKFFMDAVLADVFKVDVQKSLRIGEVRPAIETVV
jgi:hypothetical protein